jgi:hypothetical protein
LRTSFIEQKALAFSATSPQYRSVYFALGRLGASQVQ